MLVRQQKAAESEVQDGDGTRLVSFLGKDIIECGAWRIAGEDFVNGLRRKTPKSCGTTRLGRWKVNW